MADFTKRLPGCDDECGDGGERGERGKRGKRGPRGHDGRDGRDGEVGATGPTGPTAFDAVLPPFPAQAPVFVTIFANQSGSDETGDGSPENPFKTFIEAVRHVPAFVPPGFIFTIDISNLGDEVLPINYELPAWKCSHVFTANFADPFFFIQTGINIRADLIPASALSPTQSVINAGVQSQDPVTEILSIQDPSKIGPDAWVPGALKGLQVAGSGGNLERGVIYDNTSDTIFITNNFPMTFPVQILEQSARLLTTTDLFGFAGGMTIGHCESLSINGVTIEPTDPSFASLQEYASTVWYQGCTLVASSHDNPDRQIGLAECNVVGPSFITGELYLSASRAFDLVFPYGRPAQLQFSFFNGSVLDTCPTIEVADAAQGLAITGGMLFIHNALIINSTGDAVRWRCGNATVIAAEVSNANGDAFLFSGPGLHVLSQVAGSGNAGVGIHVDNGAQVQIDPSVTVTGAGDQQVGSLPPGPYPACPFNVTDIQTFSRLFCP